MYTLEKLSPITDFASPHLNSYMVTFFIYAVLKSSHNYLRMSMSFILLYLLVVIDLSIVCECVTQNYFLSRSEYIIYIKCYKFQGDIYFRLMFNLLNANYIGLSVVSYTYIKELKHKLLTLITRMMLITIYTHSFVTDI